jgi:hypothetical protein
VGFISDDHEAENEKTDRQKDPLDLLAYRGPTADDKEPAFVPWLGHYHRPCLFFVVDRKVVVAWG